jgi:Ca-activated chloride channel homolog
MFEGIYFQFPKLGFLLFFFLACETLCPLRSNPLYFPRTLLFGEVGVKPPLWLWIAKWAMITFLIVALMSPVRDREIVHHGVGWDILMVVDPSIIESDTIDRISAFIEDRPDERIALWIPENTIVPLTYEHEALISILKQTTRHAFTSTSYKNINRFFATSQEGHKLAIILSNTSKSFVFNLPSGVQKVIVSPIQEADWIEKVRRDYPVHIVQSNRRYFDYYYVYPLFLGFLAMLAYLYGRNQKGIK